MLRAKKITSNFGIEIKRIVNKYMATGFPKRFFRSIIDNFDRSKDNLMTFRWLFEERKPFTIHLSFCQNCIGETVNNTAIRWIERTDKNSKSEPAKHLEKKPTYKFKWTIISKALRTFVRAKY